MSEPDPLLRLLTESGIRSLKSNGRNLSVRFGSDTVKNLSDGTFPVEVFRCMTTMKGALEEELRCTVRLSHRLPRAVSEAGRGWTSRAKEQWVEVRTPVERSSTSKGEGDAAPPKPLVLFGTSRPSPPGVEGPPSILILHEPLSRS